VVALANLTNVHTLADLIEQGHVLSEGEAVELMRQVAVELVPLHRAGKAHERINPAAILVDDLLQARLQHPRGDASVELPGGSDEWIPREVRDRAFARMMERLEGNASAGDVYTSTASATAGETWADLRQIDVYGLAAILCRLITGKSADAYLRSPRVKGSLSESRQQFFERALGCVPGPRLRDADDFLLALEAPLTRVMPAPASAARRTAEASASPAHPSSEVLEAIDLSPSCRSGLLVGGPDEAQHAEDVPFQKLGHFDVIARLGRGGMGEVYLGYESGLDRRVAIKVLPAEMARDPDLVRRFRAEATAAARLIHPNIIQIHFIGEDAGHQFFAMQYVEGLSLAQYLARGNRPTIDQALAIIDEVLSGLVAAHRLGFVHRDIKPGNILLDSAHRRALLADFGLVKSLEDTATTHTSAGAVLGTADYSSPEQGLGQTVDFRSDLYSSGVVLYQLLCGRLPFIGKETTTVIYQHVHEPPPPLSKLAPTVPAPLVAIVERLLAKSPDDRYQSAADVLAELRAVRAGQSATGASHFSGGGDIPAVERHAGPSKRLVDTSPAISQPTLTLPAARGAGGAPTDRSRRRVLLALAGAALPAVAGGMWFALTPESQRPRWLAALTGRSPSASGEIRQFADHAAEINTFVLTPDEELLFVGDRSGKLHVWDFRMGEKRKTIRAHSGPIRRLTMSGDGRFVISASADQTLKLWDARTWKPVTQCNGHVDIVSSVAQVPGREEIVSSSFDGTLIRWETARGSLVARYGKVIDENSRPSPENVDLQSLDRHVTWVREVAVPEPGHRIYSAGNEGVIFIWDLESARVIDRLLGNSGVVMCLAASPDGTRLLAGGYQKVLCLWDLRKNELVRRIPHDSATPACVAFSPNGRLALSGGADGVVHVWHIDSGRELHRLEGHEGTATSVHFLADGRRVVSSGEDHTLRVWKLPAEIV
jgi:serine/threonine protein kinase/WD40 repeat protein